MQVEAPMKDASVRAQDLPGNGNQHGEQGVRSHDQDIRSFAQTSKRPSEQHPEGVEDPTERECLTECWPPHAADSHAFPEFLGAKPLRFVSAASVAGQDSDLPPTASEPGTEVRKMLCTDDVVRVEVVIQDQGRRHGQRAS